MDYYRGKLKRLIALSGLPLALMPCFQQSHVLCRLAGCLIPSVVASTNADEPCDRGCCDRTSDSSDQMPTQAPDEAPCGPDCWCCQPPQPREAPRDTTQSVKLRISTLSVDALSKAPLGCQSSSFDVEAVAPYSLASSSATTCARFCRFLI